MPQSLGSRKLLYMDSGIIISLILGCASIISSICFGLIPNIRKNRISKLEAQREKLFQDIFLFREIEDELLNIIAQSTGNNKISTQKSFRKLVSSKNNGKVLSENTKPSVYNKYIN